jgi:SWI/SNF-related matrix-associated actin-dependent regulator of chromatin subfamily A3
MLQVNIDAQEDCPVCIDNLKDPIITACGHVFCFGCIERVIDTQHKCPMCRSELPDINHLVKPAKETSKSDIDVDATSSKIEALLTILAATKKKHPGDKTVIFSQWTTFLDMVQAQLVKHGYRFTRLDGSMPALSRDAALDKFDNDAECTILLASLGVCSVGLNLAVANNVVMMDTWWAPAIEDQAVDRVHRLGQKKECRVWRLVMDGSIEERVLDIQEDKRKLMALAFAERMEKEKRKKGIEDIVRLLG